jgi:hypothetical protein
MLRHLLDLYLRTLFLDFYHSRKWMSKSEEKIGIAFYSFIWADMIRKVYEVDPLTCVKCGGTMKVIAFITDFGMVDRIINHLKLTFVAERPPPPHVAFQEYLIAAETSAEYFS